jgi:hypothetical protein
MQPQFTQPVELVNPGDSCADDQGVQTNDLMGAFGGFARANTYIHGFLSSLEVMTDDGSVSWFAPAAGRMQKIVTNRKQLAKPITAGTGCRRMEQVFCHGALIFF